MFISEPTKTLTENCHEFIQSWIDKTAPGLSTELAFDVGVYYISSHFFYSQIKSRIFAVILFVDSFFSTCPLPKIKRRKRRRRRPMKKSLNLFQSITSNQNRSKFQNCHHPAMTYRRLSKWRPTMKALKAFKMETFSSQSTRKPFTLKWPRREN